MASYSNVSSNYITQLGVQGVVQSLTAGSVVRNGSPGKLFGYKLGPWTATLICFVLTLVGVLNCFLAYKIYKKLIIRGIDYLLLLMCLVQTVYCFIAGLIRSELIEGCSILNYLKNFSESLMYFTMFVLIFYKLNCLSKSKQSRPWVWFIMVWVFVILVLTPTTYKSQSLSLVSAAEIRKSFTKVSPEEDCVRISVFDSKGTAIVYDIFRFIFLYLSLGFCVFQELHTIRTNSKHDWTRSTGRNFWFTISQSLLFTSLWATTGLSSLIQVVKSHPFIMLENIKAINSLFEGVVLAYFVLNPILLFSVYHCPDNDTRFRHLPTASPDRVSNIQAEESLDDDDNVYDIVDSSDLQHRRNYRFYEDSESDSSTSPEMVRKNTFTIPEIRVTPPQVNREQNNKNLIVVEAEVHV